MTERAASILTIRKLTGLVLGPLCFYIVLRLPAPEALSPHAHETLALASLMIVWWIAQALPLAITALLPVIFLPFLGITSIDNALSPYASPVVFLCLGAFILAVAMEKSSLHQRITLHIVRFMGNSADRVVAGFMVASAFMAMWIGSVASAVLMMPVALSVIQLLSGKANIAEEEKTSFAAILMLAVAYASSIGGMATLIGTPVNLITSGYMQKNYDIEIRFIDWMLFAGPIALVMLLAAWVVLVKIVFPNHLRRISGMKDVIREELGGLGPMSKSEIIVAAIFVLTLGLWIFKNLVERFIPGFMMVDDSAIAILAVILLFMIPVSLKENEHVLTWKDAERIPWGVLLLLGGALSLAGAMQQTGLTAWLGYGLSGIGDVSLLMAILLTAFVFMILVEFMNGIAVLTAFLPVVAGLAVGMAENPFFLVLTATLAASCAFALPMATAPNAIVFGSGHVKMSSMIRAGLCLNIIALIIIAFAVPALGEWVFDLAPGQMPEWAAE